MKKIKFLFSISIPMLLSNLCSSQTKDFVSGYYINQRGDTIVGYGALKSVYISGVFKFKRQLPGNDISNISFDSCRSIFLGDEIFVPWYGKRSMTYVDKYDFTIKNIDSSIYGTIPLKLLYKGNLLSLYHYYDVKDHFFLGDAGSIEELTIVYRYITDWEKRLYVRNTPAYFISPFYRNQIISKFDNRLTKKQINLIETSEYEKRSLIRLFRTLSQ